MVSKYKIVWRTPDNLQYELEFDNFLSIISTYTNLTNQGIIYIYIVDENGQIHI